MADPTNLVQRLARELHRLTLQYEGKSRAAEDMVDDARAVLVALRPTTEDMRAAGGRKFGELGRRGANESDAALVWTAIIDQALSASD